MIRPHPATQTFQRLCRLLRFRSGSLRALLITLTAFSAALAGAQESASAPAEQGEFAQCVVNLQQQARAEGISDQIVDEVLGQVTYVDRVIELDRRQPEFTQTFADYFSKRVTPTRVEKGRKLLAEHSALLARVQRKTGVPP